MMSSLATVQKVLSCRDYLSLPDRHIISSPFRKKRHISFGIMLWCEPTDSWLLVRSKQSYAYYLFLSGFYRKTDVRNILLNMTIQEISVIHALYTGTTKFDEVYKGSNLSVAQERFYGIRPYLRLLLMNVKGSPLPSWTFPKGRLEYRETPLNCALREFYEEAGIDLRITPGVYSLSENRVFVEAYTSFDHEVYETQCWFFKIDHEPELISPEGDEIAERRWVPTHQAATYLSVSKYEMLHRALKNVEPDQEAKQSADDETETYNIE
jgi:8-oxo-dGTP pyrophosphatase MutT (NUDIX family)